MSLQRAETLIELGRAEEAITVLASLGDESTTAQALCLRAQAELRLGRNKAAASTAAAARAEAPDQDWPFRLGAIAAARQGRLNEARLLAHEALRLAPHESQSHNVMAVVLLTSGRNELALQHTARLLELAPHQADSHALHAQALMALQRHAEAEVHVRKALALDPQDADALALLADVVSAQGRRREAQEHALSAVRADPQNSQNRASLARGGGLVLGGLFLAGKASFLGKILAFASLRSMVSWARSPYVVEVVLAGVLVLAFLVTRILRWSRTRALPQGVRRGLAAERVNADLLWVAVPSGLLLLPWGIALIVSLIRWQPSLPALAHVVLAGTLLVGSWRLRRGDARNLRTRDIVDNLWAVVRMNLESPRRVERALLRQPDTWKATEGPKARERIALTFLKLFLAFLVAGVFAAGNADIGFPLLVLACVVIGAVADRLGLSNKEASVHYVVICTTTGEQAGWAALAWRALLRGLLAPLLLLELACFPRSAHRFLHERLSRTAWQGRELKAAHV